MFLNQNISHLAKAKELLEQNGSLTEVALLLEAAIQKGELGKGNYEAWVLLGEVRSMDEREDQAMRALVEGVRRSQESGQPGEGMIVSPLMFTSIDRTHPEVHLVTCNFIYKRNIRTSISCYTLELAYYQIWPIITERAKRTYTESSMGFSSTSHERVSVYCSPTAHERGVGCRCTNWSGGAVLYQCRV